MKDEEIDATVANCFNFDFNKSKKSLGNKGLL